MPLIPSFDIPYPRRVFASVRGWATTSDQTFVRPVRLLSAWEFSPRANHRVMSGEKLSAPIPTTRIVTTKARRTRLPTEEEAQTADEDPRQHGDECNPGVREDQNAESPGDDEPRPSSTSTPPRATTRPSSRRAPRSSAPPASAESAR